jgi:septal ring factor EnvC (AmiA/AmiB activator)
VVFVITQDERIVQLEHSYRQVSEAVKDMNHYVTLMYGVIGKQEVDIREIKISQHAMKERLDEMERRLDGVEHQLDGMNHRLDSVEHQLNGMNHQLESIKQQQAVQDNKLDQISGMLTMLVPQTEK